MTLSDRDFPGEGPAQGYTIRMAQVFWQSACFVISRKGSFILLTRLPCMLVVGGPGKWVLVS